VKRTTEITEYLASPTGSYVASTSFLVWCAAPQLYGCSVWGCPGEAEIRQLCLLLDVEVRPAAVPHASLVDMRNLQGVDPLAFSALAAHLQAREARYRELVTAQARVRPSGLPGAVVAGFDKIVVPPHPVSLHESIGDGLAWLCGGERSDLAGELDEIVAAAMGELPLVQRLRRLLVPPLAGVTLESTARRLGMSGRTLQRHIQGEGTTFQAEYSAAQVRAAQALLRETDLKLAVIAHEVGHGSLANFSTMFRRQTGEAPSEWRRRSRLAAQPCQA
jgi:AraC-like DNA-binding protein